MQARFELPRAAARGDARWTVVQGWVAWSACALAQWAAPRAAGIVDFSHAPNAEVTFGLNYSEMELENPRAGTEHILGWRTVDWRDAGGQRDVATFGAAAIEIKWSQPPDPTEPPNLYYGWNEMSVIDSPQIAADDWVCTSQEPLTRVRWWGSYLGWDQGLPPPDLPLAYSIAIWTDVPAGIDEDFSHPGTVLWQTECPAPPPEFYGWDFDPIVGEYEACFLYDCPLPQWFTQTGDPQILWISIAAIYPAGQVVEHPWGWKTRPRDVQSPAPDDAVAIWDPTHPLPGMQYQAGGPLWFPEPEDSWDLAFELFSDIGGFVKWSQPPEPYVAPDAYNGWNELSMFGLMQNVADDWVCTTEDAVSDVTWWGSWLGWGHREPPQLPDAFHFAIWTDVPAGMDQEFSHPGQVIWDFWCTDYTWEMVGWDFDPRNPTTPPEACFRFHCEIPEFERFVQDPGDHIYWMGISAVYSFGVPEYAWGWKTRPRHADSLAPDDAVATWDPLQPLPGMQWRSGGPLWWPTPQDSWDAAFELSGSPVMEDHNIKWRQDPQPPGGGFDVESDLWLNSGEGLKWVQTPNPNTSGLHATVPIQLADDWLCMGGQVTDIHWWGNYEDEDLGDGLASFNLTIYSSVGAGMPGAVLASWNVPFASTNETDTGFTNNAGETVYEYSVRPDPPFNQVVNTYYWLEVQGVPNAGPHPPQWRWQEHGRSLTTLLRPAMNFVGGAWTPIVWPDGTFSEMAFEITSDVPVRQTNAVAADDFISDGRDILEVRWWGSYIDPRYAPGGDQPLNVVDGWLITFHWADVNVDPTFPPDWMLGDPAPTALGVYFAPREAVQIEGPSGTDCLAHDIYSYRVRLDQCCLLCSMKDPRNELTPALHGRFQEVQDWRYWISIQAEIGAEWRLPMCERVDTGHLPAFDWNSNGMFWGWHTGREPASPPRPLDQAAFGQIVSFTPYPPDCWDYGSWMRIPWACDAAVEPVNMAFHLVATDCPEDLDGNGVVDLADLSLMLVAFGSNLGEANYNGAADFDNDGKVDLADLSALLVVFGLPCPTR